MPRSSRPGSILGLSDDPGGSDIEEEGLLAEEEPPASEEQIWQWESDIDASEEDPLDELFPSSQWDPPAEEDPSKLERRTEPPTDPVASHRPVEDGGQAVERSLVPREAEPEAGPQRQAIITFAEKASPAPLTPRKRSPAISSIPPMAEKMEAPPEQDEAPSAPDFIDDFPEDFPDEDESPGETPAEDWLPREVFISRFLAGLVDFLLPAFLGLGFTAVASWVLGFDFFGQTSLQASLGIAVGFYLIGASFFLRLAGQTPGMHLTGLRLLRLESEEIPLTWVIVRVVSLPLAVVTVAGLLWGLFDPWGRCLHDHLAGTRVISSQPHP